jgi:hypothetical protein
MSLLYFIAQSKPINQEFDFPILFNPQGGQVASLQFDLSIPAGFSVISVRDGQASTDAGKNVSTNMLNGKQRVLIFGLNQNIFQAGAIAIIRLISSAAGAATFSFSNFVASDPGAGAVALTAQDGQITILGGTTVANKADLNAALNTLATTITTLQTEIAALASRQDLAPEVAKVSTAATSVQTAIDAVKVL